MKPMIRIACALALAVTCGAALAQKTQLLVYTALETDQLKAYEQGFYREVNDVEIRWVRDSTGVIIAKLLAEKANPQADVVMGVAASGLALLDQNGMLIPYAPLTLTGCGSPQPSPVLPANVPGSLSAACLTSLLRKSTSPVRASTNER